MKTSVRSWSMHKTYLQAMFMLLAVFCAFALAIPQARAASLTADQAGAVTTLLKAFDVDASTIADVQAVLSGQATVATTHEGESKDNGGPREASSTRMFPGASMCGMIARTLARGDSGDDVASLQKFLQSTGDLEASTTGFFGPATEHALQQWQSHAGIVASGNASSTGFGMLGPKTREQLIQQCKAAVAQAVTGSTNTSDQSPSCTLQASSNHISQGDNVTLTWASQNATWASKEGGGKGPTSGTITVAPTETMTYVKRVYNDGGEAACTTTVFVGDDTTTASDAHVVVAPSANVANALTAVSMGAQVLWEEFLSLFHF